MYFLSQCICVGGLLAFIFSLQQNSKPKIIIYQVVSFTLYSIKYFLLDAYSGMSIYLLNVVRSIAFYFFDELKIEYKVF